METKVIGIPHYAVKDIWDVVLPMLAPAIKRAQGVLTEDTVYNALVNRDAQLWVAITDGKIEAAATTAIVQCPGVKVLCLPLIGGKNRNHWLPFEPMFADFGRSHGCQFFEGYCRPGWIGMYRKKSGGVLGNDWGACWTVVRKPIG